jgi:lathosterol oxidase
MKHRAPTFEHAWQVFLGDYALHLFRYLLIAGVAYALFYWLFKKRALGRKIQETFPAGSEMRREFLYSLLSFTIFAGAGVLTYVLSKLGYVKLYGSVGKYGWGYLWFSLVALIFIHDAWFYWTHRLMHWRPIFRVMHAVHHQSHNPTPWASFSFHPTEAVVHAVIFPLTALFLPLHPLVALLWLTYMTAMNVVGHLGFEVLWRGFATNRFFKWHNTSVHHNQHHRRVNCNYGLYFNLWDRLLGTNHPEYEAEYRRVTERESTKPGVAP